MAITKDGSALDADKKLKTVYVEAVDGGKTSSFR
jgi:hypothetical protein